MKIGKILYDGVRGYQLSISETRKVTDILENSTKFEKYITYLREKYKIPKNGYPFSVRKYPMETIFTERDLDKFFDESRLLTNALELPDFWWSSIAHFAFYNVFFTPERVVLEVYLENNEDGYFEKCHIDITERISKTELHDLIDQEWERIEEVLSVLNKPKGHKMMRAPLAKRIVEMRDERKMKFKDIADALQKENQDNDLYDVLNEDYAKILYHRWKKASLKM